MKKTIVSSIRPTTRRALRARDGRRFVIEGYGRRSPVFVAITGGGLVPASAWLSPTELRRLIDTARRILR